MIVEPTEPVVGRVPEASEPARASEAPSSGHLPYRGEPWPPRGGPPDTDEHRDAVGTAVGLADTRAELEEVDRGAAATGVARGEVYGPVDDDEERFGDRDEGEPVAEPEALDVFLELLQADELPDSEDERVEAQALILLHELDPQGLAELRKMDPDKQKEEAKKAMSIYIGDETLKKEAISRLIAEIREKANERASRPRTKKEARKELEGVARSFWEKNPKLRKSLKVLGWTIFFLSILPYIPAFATVSFGGGGNRR